MDIKPLNISINRCAISGHIYDLYSYEQYAKMTDVGSRSAILEDYNGSNLVLPIRGNYVGQQTPGVYNAGPIDFVIYPNKEDIYQYIPSKIIEMNNNSYMKEILEKKEIIAKLDEPWITTPDSITQFPITEDDKPEMVGLKTALNKKRADIDKYAPRFGDNYPNDKRQMKNNSATLNIIKRFCKHMDMEALIIFRDKSPNVPNPIGSDVVVSLTDDYSDDE